MKKSCFNRKAFGEKLKKTRNEREMSRGELAELVMLSPQTIREYESGMRKPRTLHVVAICRALKVKMDYLVFDEEN